MKVAWRVTKQDDGGPSDPIARGVIPRQWAHECSDAACHVTGVECVSTLHPLVVGEVRPYVHQLDEIESVAFTFQGQTTDPLQWTLQRSTASDDGNTVSLSWLDMKLQRAEFHRQRGNDRFKAGKLTAAIRSYDSALVWLTSPANCTYSTEESQQVDAIAIPCHTNLSTCYWKLEEMDKCIRHATATLALDGTHTKARYRRSQAYLRTKDFDAAVKDLELLVADDGDNTLFVNGLEKAKRERQQYLTHQKELFKRL